MKVAYRVYNSSMYGTLGYGLWYLLSGSPGKIGGPLDVTEITEDSCVLLWRAPLEDGGSTVSHYLIEKKDEGDAIGWQPVSKFCRTTSHEVSALLDGRD